jgi:large subunit ribosomal protein L19
MDQKLIAFNKAQRKPLDYQAVMPELRAGDVVKIYRRIKEGAKQRTQMFQGMIIAINGAQSSSPSITVRKVSNGTGVELILPLFSPQIEKIEFVKRTRARRSKLYFVRDKSVKVLSKKLKEIALSAGVLAGMTKAAETVAEAPETTEELTEDSIVDSEGAQVEEKEGTEEAQETAEETPEKATEEAS